MQKTAYDLRISDWSSDVCSSGLLPFVFLPDLADVVVNSMLLALATKKPRMLACYPEAEFAPGLEPIEGEYVVSRTANLIAFNQTELDPILRRLGIQTVVLTGISTNVAIAGSTMAAADLGYNFVIPEDCIASGDPHRDRKSTRLKSSH